jgi:hypothetical protein
VTDWQQPAANVLLSYYKSPTVALWQQEAANVLTSSLHASSFIMVNQPGSHSQKCNQPAKMDHDGLMVMDLKM